MLWLFLLLASFHHYPTAHSSCRYVASRSCEAICSPMEKESSVNCTIRALVLLPANDFYLASRNRVLPLLQVAEQKIRKQQLLPSHIRFNWMPEDDRCDPEYALVKVMDGTMKTCAHVLFGPVCDYALASVGRIAKYFNTEGLPLITISGLTYDFEKRKTNCDNEFYMILRSGIVSFMSLPRLTMTLMKRFDWQHAFLFYESNGQRNVGGDHTCYLMMSTLGKLLREEDMTYDYYAFLSGEKYSNHSDAMKREIGNKHGSKSKEFKFFMS